MQDCLMWVGGYVVFLFTPASAAARSFVGHPSSPELR